MANNSDTIAGIEDTLPTIKIRASHGWTSLGLRDIWEYRDLLYFLIQREVQGTYRQTALGVSWLFIRPIVNMLVLSLVFGGLVKVPSDGIPYPLFSMAALLPWGYFSGAVVRASNSLVGNLHIISKIYFPRALLTLAAVISGLIDFGASFLVFLGMLLLYKMPLRLEMLWLPLFMFLSLAFSLAVGLWLATASVRYRDIAFAVNFLIQALMYTSPVIYSASLVSDPLQPFYHLNPMTVVIEGFRWALLGSGAFPGQTIYIASGIILIGLVSGAFIFRRTEHSIVDVL